MTFDIDDCEFNDLTKDLPEDTPVKITVDEPNLDPLTIEIKVWRDFIKSFIYLRMTLHHLEDYSAALWEEMRQDRNIDELIGDIKGIL